MIITFFLCLGLRIVKYKKEQICFIDDLIFMGERILLLLNSTLPETDVIINKLSSDNRLSKYDFSDLKSMSPLKKEENEKIDEMFSVLGKYDVDSQISYIQEFNGYYKMLKNEYREYYNSHCRLYIILSLSVGFVIVLLLA
ncbi:MAG: hypothetical protein ACI4RR_02840 [Eubacterium sp.]